MKRLVELTVIDGETHTYRLPSGRLEHLLDGDVVLEASCYHVDAIDRRLKLKLPPVQTLRALVCLGAELPGENAPHRNGPLNFTVGDAAPIKDDVRPAAAVDEGKMLAQVIAMGFQSVLGELQQIRRELALVHRTSCEAAHELKRSNAR